MQDAPKSGFPQIVPLGLDGLLVRFGDRFSDAANRAALAFRAAVNARDLTGVTETATAPAATLVKFDPLSLPHADLAAHLRALLDSRDWAAAPLPGGRRLWRVPAVYGGARAPHLERAAARVGMTAAEAVDHLSTARLRILAIGFAPGQPYLGELPPAWDLPRQTDLETRVPAGAIGLAIRQFVLFPAETRTGWYHVAQTAFRCFRPDQTPAFPLAPGDEMVFPAVAAEELDRLADDPDGGATVEPLR